MAASYGPTFSIDVNLTDGADHQIAVYSADYDNGGRRQRFDVVDATSGRGARQPHHLGVHGRSLQGVDRSRPCRHQSRDPRRTERRRERPVRRLNFHRRARRPPRSPTNPLGSSHNSPGCEALKAAAPAPPVRAAKPHPIRTLAARRHRHRAWRRPCSIPDRPAPPGRQQTFIESRPVDRPGNQHASWVCGGPVCSELRSWLRR